MKLEDLVCSLELAKKLKELGVKQESLFHWQNPFSDCFWEITGLKKEYIVKNNSNPENYSAFTPSELTGVLPADLIEKRIMDEGEIYEINYRLMIQKCSDNNFSAYYYEKHEELCEFEDANLANALAKILINLIENKLITVESINENF